MTEEFLNILLEEEAKNGGEENKSGNSSSAGIARRTSSTSDRSVGSGGQTSVVERTTVERTTVERMTVETTASSGGDGGQKIEVKTRKETVHKVVAGKQAAGEESNVDDVQTAALNALSANNEAEEAVKKYLDEHVRKSQESLGYDNNRDSGSFNGDQGNYRGILSDAGSDSSVFSNTNSSVFSGGNVSKSGKLAKKRKLRTSAEKKFELHQAAQKGRARPSALVLDDMSILHFNLILLFHS